MSGLHAQRRRVAASSPWVGARLRECAKAATPATFRLNPAGDDQVGPTMVFYAIVVLALSAIFALIWTFGRTTVITEVAYTPRDPSCTIIFNEASACGAEKQQSLTNLGWVNVTATRFRRCDVDGQKMRGHSYGEVLVSPSRFSKCVQVPDPSPGYMGSLSGDRVYCWNEWLNCTFQYTGSWAGESASGLSYQLSQTTSITSDDKVLSWDLDVEGQEREFSWDLPAEGLEVQPQPVLGWSFEFYVVDTQSTGYWDFYYQPLFDNTTGNGIGYTEPLYDQPGALFHFDRPPTQFTTSVTLQPGVPRFPDEVSFTLRSTPRTVWRTSLTDRDDLGNTLLTVIDGEACKEHSIFSCETKLTKGLWEVLVAVAGCLSTVSVVAGVVAKRLSRGNPPIAQPVSEPDAPVALQLV